MIIKLASVTRHTEIIVFQISTDEAAAVIAGAQLTTDYPQSLSFYLLHILCIIAFSAS